MTREGVIHLSIVRRTTRPLGKVRHLPHILWRKVPSWKLMVHHSKARGVHQCQSLYWGASYEIMDWVFLEILLRQFSISWFKQRRCFRCIISDSNGSSKSRNGASQKWPSCLLFWADVRHIWDAGVCHGIWKSNAHLTNDAPFPGVVRCVLQLTSV